MKYSTLFLSHAPHTAHVTFANAIDARIKIIPLLPLVTLSQKIPIMSRVYPLISRLYGYTLKVSEDVVLVDGGSCLHIGVALKRKYPHIKLMYLDADLLFFNLNKHYEPEERHTLHYLQAIDGVISESPQGAAYIFLDVPKRVCLLHPKDVTPKTGVRKPYGLYVGRLDPEKKIERVIQYALQCPYFEKFIVVGDGIKSNYVARMARTHEKIEYVGRQDDVGKYFSQCTYFVHIPDYEPFGTTCTEAALCGCFPIMSRGVGASHLFDDIFVVDDPGDHEALTTKIAYIQEHQTEARALLDRVHNHIPTKEQSAKHFRSVFDEILAEITT